MIPAQGAVHVDQLVHRYDVLHTGSSQKPAAEHGRDICRRQHISVVLGPYPFDLGLLPVLGFCIEGILVHHKHAGCAHLRDLQPDSAGAPPLQPDSAGFCAVFSAVRCLQARLFTCFRGEQSARA